MPMRTKHDVKDKAMSLFRQTQTSQETINTVFKIPCDNFKIDSALTSLRMGGTNADAIAGAWILKNSNDWIVSLTKSLDNKPSVNVLSAIEGTSMYMRTIHSFESDSNNLINVVASARCDKPVPMNLTLSAYSDAALTNLVSEVQLFANLNGEFLNFAGQLDVTHSGALFIVIQFNFSSQKQQIDDFDVSINNVTSSYEYEPLNISMHSFGPFEKASARLRCWKVAEAFENSGHTVSVNADNEADVYFFQKKRSISRLKNIKNIESALMVFDFDDNYFLESKGSVSEFVSFMNQMDLITVGSQYLYEIACEYHPNVLLLENPVDIISPDVKKCNYDPTHKIGWFGAPENRSQLQLVDGIDNITTVTRDGDIEFDIYTVDKILCQFDLLLFPLEITSWNSAKNANRMIKSVALGIPVLASATDEHIKTCQLLGLDEKFLVRENDSWKEKASILMKNYEQVTLEIREARERALNLYSADAIAETLFNRLSMTRKRQGLRSKHSVHSLSSTSMVSISPSRFDESSRLLIEEAELHPNSFSGIAIFTDRIDSNKRLQYHNSVNIECHENVFDMYGGIDHHIETTSSEFILLTESGIKLFSHIENHINYNVDVCALDLTLKNSNVHSFPRTNLDAYRVILERTYPKAILVRRSWLLEKNIKAEETLSYFLLTIWLEALLCNDTSCDTTSIPVGLLLNNRKPTNISTLFYENLVFDNPALKDEVPGRSNQWIRISEDIFNTILSRHKAACPSLLANCIARHYACEERQ